MNPQTLHSACQLKSLPSLSISSRRRTRLVSLMVSALAIAFATWLGSTLQLAAAPEASKRIRLDDPVRGWVFDGDTQSGEVRVIRYRGGVTELARLKADTPRQISALRLDPTGSVLIVESGQGRDEYELHGFHARKPAPAIRSALAANSNKESAD